MAVFKVFCFKYLTLVLRLVPSTCVCWWLTAGIHHGLLNIPREIKIFFAFGIFSVLNLWKQITNIYAIVRKHLSLPDDSICLELLFPDQTRQ